MAKLQSVGTPTYLNLNPPKEEYEVRHSSKLDSPFISGQSWWQTIKSLLSLNKNTSIPALLLDNGEAVHENHTKSNVFNEYFSSQCQLDDHDLPIPPFNHLSDNRLHNLDLSEKNIIDHLKILNLSKASGPDGISPRMLKHTALSISQVLAKLFNLYLRTSYFSLSWKQANVIPVFKKGNHNLTPVFKKRNPNLIFFKRSWQGV